jgi:HEAT repeat protein
LAWQCLEELNNAGAVEDTAYNVIDKTFGFYQSYLFTNPLLQHFNREYILPAVLDSPASSSDAGLIAGWADKVPMFEFGHWYGWSVYDVGKFIGRLGRGQEAVRESAARLLDYEKSHYAATSAAVFIIAEGWKNAPDTAGFLRRQAVSGTPPDTRVAAIHALSEYFMEDAATLPLLLALAADPDYRAREAVVLVLSEHSRDAASVLPLLRDRVLNDKSIFVRTAATQALGTHHRENADVIRLIQDVAVRDEHPHARSVGLSTLAKAVRADKQVLALLCERALQDTDAGVRVTAVDILVEHFRDSPQALAVVHKVAIDDPSPPAREDVYVSSLRPRYKAIEVLAQAWASHPDTLKLLRNRADNDPNPQVQKRAEELLSQLEGKQGAGVI